MSITSQNRRTWKRAPVKKARTLIKENGKQRVEKTTYNNQSAILITYKDQMTLKNLTYLKKATNFLSLKNLPFSKLLTFDRSPSGYRGVWSYCEGRNRQKWSIDDYRALGSFLGKFHQSAKDFNESSPQKLPLVITLREKYEELKEYIPESFDQINPLIETIENNWPLYLTTGLVHTDLFSNNILFKNSEVSGILQNHDLQIDILLYDLTPVIKSLYFSECENMKEKEKAFFDAYTQTSPIKREELLALPTLTAAKFVFNALNLIESHLNDSVYQEAHLNAAAISLVHAEKALHLYQ